MPLERLLLGEAPAKRSDNLSYGARLYPQQAASADRNVPAVPAVPASAGGRGSCENKNENISGPDDDTDFDDDFEDESQTSNNDKEAEFPF
jgi:hypothetical protein